MSNPITLYKLDLSAPSRAVMIVAHLLGLKLEIRNLNFLVGEQYSEWFLKLNPEHTVPTIVDSNGQVIWESHAICAYLVDKYGKDDSLYPKDLYLRAKCNQRMYFIDSRQFIFLRGASSLILGPECSTGASDDKIAGMYEGYDLLEAQLDDDFLVGKKVTIADISAVVVVASLDEIYAPISPEKYPKITAWLKRMKKLPFYEEMNGKPIKNFRAQLMNAMATNKKREAAADKIILYKHDLSAPSRAVAIVAHLLGLGIKTRDLDFFGGEHLEKWFVEINAEHDIPTLVDNGQVIWESPAICSYLVDKFGRDDSLYPKDLYLRARVDQRLYFTNSILFVRLRNASASVFAGATEISEDKTEAMHMAYELLEAMLVDDFIRGNTLTIADICTMVVVTSMDEIYTPIAPEKYPKIAAWLKRIKKLPFYEEMNGKHVTAFKAKVKNQMEANKKRAV